MRGFRVWVLATVAVALSARGGFATFTTFETGQVRPLAMSPDGSRLFVVNTPDDYLEIFSVDAGTGALTHEAAVPVGLEPVAVAARSNGEVWVVNHLSDSVSIVDVAASPPRVVRTLLVGDEPRDVVFAGTGGARAFVTAAHRGQNRPGDPQLTTAGIGRADVWVFDTNNLGAASLGGTPLSILTLFTDTPRALAVSPDGTTVYAAGFHTGNRTTAISEGLVCDGGAAAPPCSVFGSAMPGGLPAPNANVQGFTGPETGLVLRFDGASGHWKDGPGRTWDNAVRFNLPDRDVFAINANNLAAPPASFVGVGTILFNMVTNPVSGKVYVSNSEARNEVRFEGPGILAGSSVRGHLHEARITVLDGASVLPRHLNPHIDYGTVPSPAGIKEASLATPLGMAVTGDGATLYVAAFGSSVVGIFATSELENDTFTPSAADHIPVTGGGPSGLVLNEAAARLYVFTRFDNAISVIDTTTAEEIAHLPVHNPEPPAVVSGRHVLYDAVLSSSNGEAACASCHVFADFDSLAWDLGNPDDVLLNNPNPFEVGSGNPFHPMKGPMTTQSLRGLANHGPMHWRGDRTGGNDPGGSALDENAAFNKFIVAFDGLLGRGAPISATDMQAFADFILEVTYPPNPIRALDDSLTPAQQAGHDLFFGPITDGVRNCDGCHLVNPAAGFFGGSGKSSIEGEPQEFKIPHLRNLYQKIGMFGMPAVPFFRVGDNAHKGDQVRGFGFLHDGSVDTLFRFHGANAFTFGVTEAAELEQFMLASDSNLKPIVGQQVTLTGTNAAAAGPRIDLLLAQDDAGACELTVKGVLAGEQRGWLRLPGGAFQSDRASEATLTDAQLRTHPVTPEQERTYLCVPPGSGARVGIDRDEDGFLDRDEIDAGSDPADPASTPGGSTTTTTVTTTSTTTTTILTGQVFIPIPTKKLTLRDRSTPPADPNRRKVVFKSVTNAPGSPFHITPPPQGSPDDPRTVGAIVAVYNSVALGGELVPVGLPPAGWRATGSNAYKYKGASTAGITGAVLKPNLLAFKGGKAGWNYTLNEPSQGRVATVFILGSTIYCSDAPAKASGNPPSTTSNDHVDKFIAAPNTPPPPFCINP
jgi:DNA-binding beta-propeller fold protein YncE/mono/diheme cytochrome c family protein